MTRIAVLMGCYAGDDPEQFVDAMRSLPLGSNDTTGRLVHAHIGIDGPIGDRLTAVLQDFSTEGVVIHRFERNRGLAATLNDLIDATWHNYDYIARFDGDDLWCPGRLDAQLDHLRDNPEHVLVGAQANLIDERGNHVETRSYPVDAHECRRLLPRLNPVLHPTYLVRSEVFANPALRYPSAYLSEDLAFLVRLTEEGLRFANVAQVGHYWRIGPDFARRRSSIKRARAEWEWYRRAQLAVTGSRFAPWALIRAVVRLVPTGVAAQLYRSSLRRRVMT